METPAPKPSLQTIADRLGVSRATVSLAMRNQSCISEATRSRVRATAEEIGYRPNPMISSLMAHIKSGRPVQDAGVIAFLTNYSEPEAWKQYSTLRRYFAGASERALQGGYLLEEVWLREPGMTVRKMRDILFNRGVEGILVAPTPASSGHLTMDLSSFAVATMGHSVVRPKLHRAAPYHMESLRITVRHLRHLGYRSIGMAMERSQDERNGTNWTAAFLGYQQTLPANSRIPLFYTYSAKDAELAAWITRYRPEVIIAGNSQILAKLEKMGLEVPADIGLAVLDLSTTDIDISGIDQMPELVGSAAMDMIVAQIQRNERGVPSQTKLLLTEGIWVPGKTLRRIEKNSRSSTNNWRSPAGA